MSATKRRIDFQKETCQPLALKKGDRLIVSGPCEIQLENFRIASSLDSEAVFLLSMPRETKTLKLKPHDPSFDQQGAIFVKQEQKQRH